MQHLFGSKHFRKGLEEKWQRLYRVAYSWCHDAHLAKDLVQESISRAIKNSQQLRDPASLDGWLFKILFNCWRDCCRDKREQLPIEDDSLIEDRTPETIHVRDSIVRSVRGAVMTLKIEYREVISLVDLAQMSYKEVAEILDIPVGTVMSRLCRARNQLREELQKLNDKSSRTIVRRIK